MYFVETNKLATLEGLAYPVRATRITLSNRWIVQGGEPNWLPIFRSYHLGGEVNN